MKLHAEDALTKDHNSADLARDAVLHDEEGVRSHLLKTLPFSPSALKTMLRELDQLDVSKNLRVVTKLGKNPASAFLSHHYQGSAHGGLDILEELQNTFPPPRARVQVIAQQDRRSSRSSITVLEDLQNSFSHARIQEQVNAHRLWLDLALSSTILFSEELNKTGEFLTQKTFEPVDGAVTPDDDFARATGLLSLNDHKAPPIAFSLLSPQPRVTFGDSDSSDQPLQVEGPDQRVQGETARSLMAEWIVGTDPRAFEWKGWRGNSTTEAANSYASRPIRPHPSPRITQIAFDPTPNQAKKLPFPARAAVSEPALLSKVPPIVQSSPPLDRPQQGTGYHEIGPSTQVEPGPYGGRPAGGAGKKKIKKRIGGF